MDLNVRGVEIPCPTCQTWSHFILDKLKISIYLFWDKNSEYGQEIPQSQTADNPVAPRGRAAQPSQDTRKTN